LQQASGRVVGSPWLPTPWPPQENQKQRSPEPMALARSRAAVLEERRAQLLAWRLAQPRPKTEQER